jgi:serine/threonine protein kinase
MNAQQVCNRCGAELSADSPRGLCVGCLLQLGLANPPGEPEAATTPSPAPASGAGDAGPDPAAARKTVVIDQGRAADEPSPAIPDYQLLRRIGDGAYGEVWLARNILGTCRAIKVVHRKTFRDSHPYEREFNGIKKFEAVSGSHPGLLHILHVGRNDSSGYFYYAMELADDEQSGQRIDPARYRPKTLRSEIDGRGRLPLDECVQIGLSLAKALEHLHGHGLIHRDIKPANILFVKGALQLGDIGLVTGIGEAVTQVFTPGYNPPEGPGAPAADVFSLGKVLYVISTGHAVDQFPKADQNGGSAGETRLSRFLAIVRKACANNVGDRYPSAQALRADLERLEQNKPITATPPERWPAEWRIPATLAAALLALLTSGVLLWKEFGRSGREGPPAAFIPPAVASLPAGEALKIAYTGSPPAPVPPAPKPQLQFGIFARRHGSTNVIRLQDDDELASEVDTYRIRALPLTPGHLYVFQVDSSGKLDWLFPKNPASALSVGTNPVPSGQPIRIPAAETNGLFLDHTTGIEHIYLVFSATRWPELEAELAKPAALAAAAQTVQTPNGLLTRGVGGERRKADTAALNEAVQRMEESQRLELPYSDRVLESTGSFMVKERWFRHVNPP